MNTKDDVNVKDNINMKQNMNDNVKLDLGNEKMEQNTDVGLNLVLELDKLPEKDNLEKQQLLLENLTNVYDMIHIVVKYPGHLLKAFSSP